jgi:hypothetical protein
VTSYPSDAANMPVLNPIATGFFLKNFTGKL